MKRLPLYLVVVFLVQPGLLVAGRIASSLRSTGDSLAATTLVCGQLNSNATWASANSPFDVCAQGVTVMPGVTLTIEPGVTVQFEAGAGSRLNVSGVLDAIGAPSNPITLTGVTATPGSWYGISADGSLASPAQVSLDYVTLEYGGVNGSFGAQVYADHAALSIDHSQVRDGAGSGLYMSVNTRFDVHRTSFTGNGLDAIRINTPSADLLMTDLSASGNGTDMVHILGTTAWPGQRQWAFPGIPYLVDGQMSNSNGDMLTIEAGSQLVFTPVGFLSIGGELKALGTPDSPILMTGQTNTSGAWRGIYINGNTRQAVVQLDYATVEYAGSSAANIEIQDGALIADHSLIRDSLKDGVRLDTNAGTSIRNSQITGNLLYGIRNLQPTRAVLAADNWWGDPTGPQSDLSACSQGLGDKVTAGVLFLPVLGSSNATADFPLSSAPTLELSPHRWFAPADGITRVYFDITLRDGNGLPLPGRTVKLSSNLGSLTDGGITDASGRTLAYLTSTATGDANVSASLDATSACEAALSPTAKVTFTQPLAITDLMPNATAPYMDGDLTVSPMPVMTGVTTTIYARLTNPLAVPVTVDVEFGFAQSGIGLVFGPIKDITGQIIPANSSVTLSGSFVPSVSGHYCVQVSFNITAVGTASAPLQVNGGPQYRRLNLNVYQSTTGSPQKASGLEKTRKSLKVVNKFVDATYDTDPISIPLQLLNKLIGWDLNAADQIDRSLKGDPPRQDYRQIDKPQVMSLPPVQPGGGLSPASAAALNELNDALVQANAYGRAAATALDRYGGASEANDLQWASLQSAALLEYNRLMGTEIITASLKIDQVLNVAASEGVTSFVITSSDVISMQQHLASGFTSQQIADAHAVGLSDAEIESIRQEILATPPDNLAGDLVPKMQAIRDQFYQLGLTLQNPHVFAPGFSVTGGAGLAPQLPDAGNLMAQVYDSQITFQLSNPLTQTAQLDVRTRRIDLPADWGVAVSPAQVSLAPGQTLTVTVSVVAGAPLPQGSKPRVAVEAYAAGELLGGVTLDVFVPDYTFFDGNLRLYLPLVKR